MTQELQHLRLRCQCIPLLLQPGRTPPACVTLFALNAVHPTGLPTSLDAVSALRDSDTFASVISRWTSRTELANTYITLTGDKTRLGMRRCGRNGIAKYCIDACYYATVHINCGWNWFSFALAGFGYGAPEPCSTDQPRRSINRPPSLLPAIIWARSASCFRDRYHDQPCADAFRDRHHQDRSHGVDQGSWAILGHTALTMSLDFA